MGRGTPAPGSADQRGRYLADTPVSVVHESFCRGMSGTFTWITQHDRSHTSRYHNVVTSPTVN